MKIFENRPYKDCENPISESRFLNLRNNANKVMGTEFEVWKRIFWPGILNFK